MRTVESKDGNVPLELIENPQLIPKKPAASNPPTKLTIGIRARTERAPFLGVVEPPVVDALEELLGETPLGEVAGGMTKVVGEVPEVVEAVVLLAIIVEVEVVLLSGVLVAETLTNEVDVDETLVKDVVTDVAVTSITVVVEAKETLLVPTLLFPTL